MYCLLTNQVNSAFLGRFLCSGEQIVTDDLPLGCGVRHFFDLNDCYVTYRRLEPQPLALLLLLEKGINF